MPIDNFFSFFQNDVNIQIQMCVHLWHMFELYFYMSVYYGCLIENLIEIMCDVGV